MLSAAIPIPGIRWLAAAVDGAQAFQERFARALLVQPGSSTRPAVARQALDVCAVEEDGAACAAGFPEVAVGDHLRDVLPAEALNFRNWRARVWRPACERAEVRAVPYDGRHTYASLLIHEGRSLPTSPLPSGIRQGG